MSIGFETPEVNHAATATVERSLELPEHLHDFVDNHPELFTVTPESTAAPLDVFLHYHPSDRLPGTISLETSSAKLGEEVTQIKTVTADTEFVEGIVEFIDEYWRADETPEVTRQVLLENKYLLVFERDSDNPDKWYVEAQWANSQAVKALYAGWAIGAQFTGKE